MSKEKKVNESKVKATKVKATEVVGLDVEILLAGTVTCFDGRTRTTDEHVRLYNQGEI